MKRPLSRALTPPRRTLRASAQPEAPFSLLYSKMLLSYSCMASYITNGSLHSLIAHRYDKSGCAYTRMPSKSTVSALYQDI